MRSWAVALVVAALAVSSLHTPAHAAGPARRTESLYGDALRRLAQGAPAQRQFARDELESALRLAPGDDAVALALGRLYVDDAMLLHAREVVGKLLARNPVNAEAQALMGEIERLDWLENADDDELDHAIASFARSMRLGARDLRRGQLLVPLLIEAREDSAALAVAEWTARTAPRDPQAWLLVAYAAQAAGDLERADALFTKAIPALPARLRARFGDLSPLLPYNLREPYEDLAPSARAARTERFWRMNDPDPVSEVNEARLEFDARIVHALLLYGVDDFGDLDERGKITVRFGSPAYRERNRIVRWSSSDLGTSLAWTYPDLGMRVWLGATNPLGHYRSRYGTAVQAFPDSLARHPELRPALGGWAMFRALPEGVTPLDARCEVARFEGPDSRRVHAQVEAAADPSARLVTDWVVLDSLDHAVTRVHSDMSPSACGPIEVRAAAFDTALAPGRYVLAARVDDGDGHRAVLTRELSLAATDAALALSDLVVVCGRPEPSLLAEGGVRLEPSTGLLPQTGEQLVAYFEIYHLRPDAGGERHYEYECTVSPEAHDRRSFLGRFLAAKPGPAPIQMTRREDTRGEVRRQYFTVPVQALPPGAYRMEVRVRDLMDGAETSSLAVFERR
jgi:GWxTD domain-containing protein